MASSFGGPAGIPQSQGPRDEESLDGIPSEVSRELLSRCVLREREAQRELFEATHEAVYRLAARMVGVQDAADLVQQIYLNLFRKVHLFEGHSKFETWLHRLAVNECLQHLRRKQRYRIAPLETEPPARVDTERDHGEYRELLDSALERLDPELRAVFVLREMEDRSYQEIATITGIPVGTVGSRLNRARSELRAALAQLGWEV